MRFELPAEKKLVHRMTLPLRWGDMDAMGHINNTLYFRYFEIVRLDWLFSVGAAKADEGGTGEGPIIVNAFCNFLRQLKYPGDIEVKMFTANLGRSSFDTFHELRRADETGVVVAEGGAKVVWTDYAQGRSAPLPEALRALVA
jgi:acyl-CoA thioester hydrolase